VVAHYSRVRVDEFVLEVILLLYMSVSVVSKLMERSYRYCYKLFTSFLPRLSTSIESFYGVVEVDEVCVSAGLKGRRRGKGRYESDKIPVMVMVSRYGDEEYIPNDVYGGR